MKRTIITTGLVARMVELRKQNVSIRKIALLLGVNKETVHRHTSEFSYRSLRQKEKRAYAKKLALRELTTAGDYGKT